MDHSHAPSDELPLSELFARGASVSHEVESSSGRLDKDTLKEGIRLLELCEQRVNSLSLFSANEELEEVATGDLKYLLTAYYLGLLLSSLPEEDPVRKHTLLVQAQDAFARFLRLCKAYELIPSSARIEVVQDAHTKRALKIQRYKDLKAAKSAVLNLQGQTRRKNRLKELAEGQVETEDEGAEREIWVKQIEIAVLQAVDQQPQLAQEIEIVAHASTMPAEDREKPLLPPPADVLQKLQLAASNLGSQRDQIAADVYRPSHALPTRTLKEQAEIEMEMAKSAAERQAAGEANRKKLEADEDYMIAKQRAWDDWKDDNPRGSGNSKLRPTA